MPRFGYFGGLEIKTNLQGCSSHGYLNLCLGESVQKSDNVLLDAADIGKVLGLSLHRGLDLGEIVFVLQKLTCEVYKIFQEVTKLVVLGCGVRISFLANI